MPPSCAPLVVALGLYACTSETRTTVTVAAEDRVRVEAGSFYWRLQNTELYEAAPLAEGPRDTGEVELPQALSLVPEGGDASARAALEVGLLGGASGLEIVASTVTDVRFIEGRHLRRELRLGESACLLDFVCCRDRQVSSVDQAHFCAPRRCLGLGPDEVLCAADTGAFRCEGGQCIPVGACEEGETRSCGGPPDGDPACLGQTRCVDGQFGPCEGAARLVAPGEVCSNGVDDDCDLSVDEGCPTSLPGEPVVDATGEVVTAFAPVTDAWGLRLEPGPPGELAMLWLQTRTIANVLSFARVDVATLTSTSQATESGGEARLPPDVLQRSEEWVYAFGSEVARFPFENVGLPGPSLGATPPGIVTDLAVREDGAVFYASEVGGCEVDVRAADEMVTTAQFQSGEGARFGKLATTSDGFVGAWLRWPLSECRTGSPTIEVQRLDQDLRPVASPRPLAFMPADVESDAFDLAVRGNQLAVCVGTTDRVELLVLEGDDILRTTGVAVGPFVFSNGARCRVAWLGDAIVSIAWREAPEESFVVGVLWAPGEPLARSLPLASARVSEGVRHTLGELEVLPGEEEVAFLWSVLQGDALSFQGARLRFE